MTSTRPLALITGASRGVGAAVARELAPTHRLLLGGRDTPALHETVAALEGAEPFAVELTDSASLADAVRGIDQLDVLVHSAGVAEIGAIADQGGEVWRRTMEVNVIAVVELTRLLLPALRAAGGHVVLVNSGAGLRPPNPGWGSYAASKHALRAFADALNAEEREHGVRVTSVFPGRVATDMQRQVRAAEGTDYVPEHYLRPETVARAVGQALSTPADGLTTEIVLRPA
ncbi:SDR family oxidoreductase [Actinoalloteichus spitiensis]|uniref:SDR family oxidoreductase n=1 Tax=Actinoalloteichus spitiensis TaxID=252394 RepID=UPI0004750E8B|nr:SDR family oxidoreductase [Actinoalloteichus spitiensis]